MGDFQQVLQIPPPPPVVVFPTYPRTISVPSLPPVITYSTLNAPVVPTFAVERLTSVNIPAVPTSGSVPLSINALSPLSTFGLINPLLTMQTKDIPYYIPFSYLSSLQKQDPLTVSTVNAQIGNISTLNAQTVNAVSSFVGTGYTVSSFNQNILTDYIEATEAYVYDKLTLDNQVLTANSTDLLLNGIPIATTNNISSIADWAFDPAVSTIQANGNDLTNVRFANFSSIIADGLTVVKLTTLFSTTIEVFESTITSETQKLTVSSINGGNASFNILTANSIIAPTTSTITASTINCEFLNVSSNANIQTATFSNGANFNGTRPNFNTGINTTGANNFNNTNLDNCGQINAGTLSLFGSGTASVLVDSGGSILTNSAISLATQNGGSSVINIEAKRNALLAYPIPLSQVNIVAEGNCPNIPVVPLTPYGGAVNISANAGPDPIFPLTALTNAFAPGAIHLTAYSKQLFPGLITESAGSILAYSGLTSPTAGLYGCSFYSALTCLSLSAGLSPALTSFPGTVFLRGDNGTKVVNGLYCDNLYNNAGGNLNIQTQGGYWVDINNTQALRMGNNALIDGGGGTTSIIQNFYNINGSNVTTPQLNVNNISTGSITLPQLYTSHINIAPTTTVFASAPNLTIDANIVTDEFVDPLPNSLNLLASSNINITIPNNNAYSINMSGNVYASKNLYVTQEVNAPKLSTMNLNVSSINNAVYPPPSGVPSNLTVSTLNVSSVSVANVTSVAGTTSALNAGYSWTQGTVLANWTGIATQFNSSYYACASPGFIYFYNGTTTTQQATSQNWSGITVGAIGSFVNAMACVSGGGIWRTTDSGATWTVTTAPTGNWKGITATSATTYYAIASDLGLYYSTNTGTSWVRITGSFGLNWSAITRRSGDTFVYAVVNGGKAYAVSQPSSLFVVSSIPNGAWTSISVSSLLSKFTGQSSAGYYILGRNDGNPNLGYDSGTGTLFTLPSKGFTGQDLNGAVIISALPNTPLNYQVNASPVNQSGTASLPWTFINSCIQDRDTGIFISACASPGYIYTLNNTPTYFNLGDAIIQAPQSITLSANNGAYKPISVGGAQSIDNGSADGDINIYGRSLFCPRSVFYRASQNTSFGRQPFTQFGRATTGTTSPFLVTFSFGFADATSFVVSVTHNDTSPLLVVSVSNVSANSFRIYWSGGGAVAQNFNWVVFGN